MSLESIQSFLERNPDLGPWAVGAGVLVLAAVAYLVARYLVARGLISLAARTRNRYDDIVVVQVRLTRLAWIAPLLVIYYAAGLVPAAEDLVRKAALFVMLWLGVLTVNALLDAVNAIYEASGLYKGQSIQGYLDLLKIAQVAAALILTVSLFTEQSPWVLLSGLGAAMAVLLLLFHDTLLSFVASVQIQANDLIKEGDWIEVPSYGADGEVLNISLHTVTIRNWDMTLSMIPTYKVAQEPYRNWRGMEESGGRRMKRAIHIDLNSIRFADDELLARLGQIDLVRDFLDTRLEEVKARNRALGVTADSPVECPQLTNIEVFQAYATNYLRARDDLHQEGLPLLVHQLSPRPDGLPLEVYAFTKTTDWAQFEAIQAEILNHLLASVPEFGLRVFQQPTGLDFQAFAAPRLAPG
jgi:miniconductance mechanosensitive channel